MIVKRPHCDTCLEGYLSYPPKPNLERFSVGRRGIKEYRPAEALQLILADRDHLKNTPCPSCGHKTIERSPKRRLPKTRWATPRQVTLKCKKCSRQAMYVPGKVTQPSETELVSR